MDQLPRLLKLAGFYTITVAAFLILAVSIGPVQAQVYLSPNIETAAGNTSNRFLSSGEEGSAYISLWPAAELTWFVSDDAELNFSLSHFHCEYLEDDFSYIKQTVGKVFLDKTLGGAETRFSLAAGDYRDGALPGDDNRWIEFSPYASFGLADDLTGYAELSIMRSRYRSRETLSGGEKQEDTLWRLKPGLVWTEFNDISLWAEVFLEFNKSNENTQEYRAGGAALGCDLFMVDALSAGIWIDGTLRYYPNRPPDESENQRDTPVSLGIWGNYRFSPWMEAVASAQWQSHQSTSDNSDYSLWTVEAGLRLTYDVELPWR
jgi:hypothetical protein